MQPSGGNSPLETTEEEMCRDTGRKRPCKGHLLLCGALVVLATVVMAMAVAVAMAVAIAVTMAIMAATATATQEVAFPRQGEAMTVYGGDEAGYNC